MPSHLYSARAKFVWAHQQVKSLRADMAAYAERKPAFVEVEQDSPLTYIKFTLRVREEMPSLEWGLRLADAIQSLRSSLDHAIFELHSRYEGVWPNPPSKPHTLQFPICDDPLDFQDAKWRLGLLKEDDRIVRRIERLQPYNRQFGENRGMLSILRDLNDRDKHRVIHIVRGHTRALDVTVFNATDDPIDGAIASDGFGPVSDGAHLMTFLFFQPNPDVKVHKEPIFTFYPAIEHPITRLAKAEGRYEMTEIAAMLGALKREVRYAVTGVRHLIRSGVVPG